MRRRAAAAILLMLAGCDDRSRVPTGQVVATMDGIDITRRDVLIELIASGAPADVRTDIVQPMLLARIVDRKLLAREAARLSVDRSPEFLGEERRSRETILGDHLVRRIVGRLPPPSPAAVARYVAANRASFDRRVLFHVDRLTFDPADDDAALGRLPGIHALAAELAARHRQARRFDATIDSLTLPPAHAAALRTAAPGRPVMLATPDGIVVDAVRFVEPRPVPAADRARFAAALMANAAARDAATALRHRLRSSARIICGADSRAVPGAPPAGTGCMASMRTP